MWPWRRIGPYSKVFKDQISHIYIRPHRSVGAGRASGAVASELVNIAKTSSPHILI